MRKNELRVLFTGIFALTIFFVICGLLGSLDLSTKLNTAQVLEIIITITLVIVTAIYVKRTAEIAEANTDMAEEMREQRLSVSQPLVFPDLREVRFPDHVAVPFRNLGNGPALNLTISFADAHAGLVKSEWQNRTGPTYSKLQIDDPNWTIITTNNEVKTTLSSGWTKGSCGTAFVEYSDIYGRRFLAGWEYCCEEDGSGRLVLRPTEPLYPVMRKEV